MSGEDKSSVMGFSNGAEPMETSDEGEPFAFGVSEEADDVIGGITLLQMASERVEPDAGNEPRFETTGDIDDGSTVVGKIEE
jgi:hypothetical protein